MANQELFQALNMFSSGMKELAVGTALTRANDQVREIKQSALKEHEQRAAIQEVSNSIMGTLVNSNLDSGKLQAVMNIFQPKRYSSAAEAAIEGSLTGNQKLVEAAKQADIASQAGNMAQLEKQNQYAVGMQNLKLSQAKELAGMKQQKQGQGDVEFGTNVSVALKEAKKLGRLVDQFGGFEVANPKAAARLNSASYQLAINYAKIVDPASVAREGEVAAAQKYLIPMGVGTRNSVTKEAIKKYEETIKEYVRARGKQKQIGGAVVSDTQQQPTDDLTSFLE